MGYGQQPPGGEAIHERGAGDARIPDLPSHLPAEGPTRYTPANLCLLILGMGSIVYWKFLVFEKLLIYRDIGVDTLNGLWPILVAHARGLSSWTFQAGLGQSIYTAWVHGPLERLATLLGEERVVFALPYLMVAKSLMAGVLAQRYLTAVGVSQFAAFVGATAYSHCGVLVLLGGWAYPFGTAAVVAVLLLYSVELFLVNKPLLVPVASASIVLSGPFHLFFFSLVATAYLVFRLAFERGAGWKSASPKVLRFAGYFALGVALTCWLSLPELADMQASPRAIAGGDSLFTTLISRPPWKLVSGEELTSAVIRLFGNDITGTGSNYHGWRNAMESPAFYCGLVLLVALPQVFLFVDRRRRVLWGGLVGVCVAYLVFPYFRQIFSGFTGDYYRVTSLLVTLVILFLGAQALSCIEQRGLLHRTLLWATTAGLCLTLLSAYLLVWRRAQPGTFPWYGGLLVTATIIALVLHAAALQRLAGVAAVRPQARALVALLVAAEVCGVSYVSVNHRMVLPATYLKSGNGYYDGTSAATAALRAEDPGFFRIEKDRYWFLNDSLFQNFNGTRSYQSFNHPSYIGFLRALDVPFYFPGHTAYIDGFGSRYLLNALVSVKYLLASRPVDFPGYVYRGRYGAAAVYQNENSLPFGFTYDTVLPADIFSTLKPRCRDVALLRGFVPSPTARGRLDAFDFKPLPADASCKAFSLAAYADMVRSLSLEHLEIEQHGETRFKGSITVSRDKMLFLSIPFDRGWSVSINGRPAQLENVNLGFSGVPLHPGSYTIDLAYELPGLKLGLWISSAGLLVFLALLARGWAPVRRAIRR